MQRLIRVFRLTDGSTGAAGVRPRRRDLAEVGRGHLAEVGQGDAPEVGRGEPRGGEGNVGGGEGRVGGGEEGGSGGGLLPEGPALRQSLAGETRCQ